MVGGVVIGLTRLPDGRTHVNVAECPHYPKHGIAERPDGRKPCPSPDTCCVYTDEKRMRDGTPVTIQVGDSLWWQSGKCYYTPRERAGQPASEVDGVLVGCGTDYDIALTKLGYSH